MPLRKTEPFDEWANRDHPSPALEARVWDWIDDLGSSPFQFPSSSFPELSDDDSEFRTAVVPHSDGVSSEGVEVFYRYFPTERATDLIHVRTMPLTGR